MICPRAAVDKNAIKKYQDEATQELPEDVVHECLEGCRGIAQAERHHQELVEAVVSAECRLVDVGGPHANLVVPRPQVELGEEAGAVELVEQLVDDGDRKRILDGERVQRTVVDAKAPCPVRLLDEDDRRGES